MQAIKDVKLSLNNKLFLIFFLSIYFIKLQEGF
jgi:hypothetical protein